MSNKQHRSSLQHLHDALGEDVSPDVNVHGGERVVQQVHIPARVYGPRKADSLFLTT